VCTIQPPSAGGGLFNWQVKHDCDVVQHGPYELRILESYVRCLALSEGAMEPDAIRTLVQPPMAKADIQASLRKYIHQLRGTDDSKYCEPETRMTRNNVSCDHCHMLPISETWYHCGTCGDFDLCLSCYDAAKATGAHNPSHIFERNGAPLAHAAASTTTTTSAAAHDAAKQESGCVVQ